MATKSVIEFNPNKLPKGFPPDGMTTQHGKKYITHVGLVWLANHRGKPWNSTIAMHDIRYNDQGEPTHAWFIYKVWDDEREHMDVGDADLRNVGRNIAPHFIRMASTRAQNRALRAFVGYAGCTADELALADLYEQNQDQQTAPQQTASRRQPAADTSQQQSGFAAHVCPACGGRVVDNRQRATRARENNIRQPYWFCENGRQCPGGKGDFSWAEFDDMHWGMSHADRQRSEKMREGVEVKK